MSFILDALRKSEHERQRQTGPVLVEVATAPPKARSNTWATAVVGLLIVNVAAIGVLLLVRSNRDAATVIPPAAQPGGPPTVLTDDQRPNAGAGAPPPAVAPPPAIAPPPMLRPAEVPPGGARNPLEEEVSDVALPEAYLAGAASTPPGPPAVVPSGAAGYQDPGDYPGPAAPSRTRGSVVYQSIPEADPITNPARTSASTPATSGLPTVDEAAAANGLPELKLELHVYSSRAADRFVFINSRKYHEGEALQEGATVESITPDGVILSARGNRFLLPRE